MSTAQIIKYVAGSYGTNIYLVYNNESKEAFIVDPGSQCDKLISDIDRLGLVPSHIILTHGHGDHTDGIEYVRKSHPDIKLIASKKERSFLYNRDMSRGKGGIAADIWTSDGEVLSIAGMDLKFIDTPGHTPGSMCILLDDVLFSGDTLFFGSVGRTDLPGGNEKEIIVSIKEKLLVLGDNILVLPGHMKETSIGFERRYNPFV